jgi:hypothetical protein
MALANRGPPIFRNTNDEPLHLHLQRLIGSSRLLRASLMPLGILLRPLPVLACSLGRSALTRYVRRA